MQLLPFSGAGDRDARAAEQVARACTGGRHFEKSVYSV